MKPYIIKKADHFLSNFILSSFFYIFFLPWLILTSEISLLICLSIAYICYLAYLLYKIKIFKKKYQNYESLVIDANGIKCEDEKEIFYVIWNDISEIRFYRNGPPRGARTEMTIICNDDDNYTFSFEPYTYAINLYRLKNRIIGFSNRKNIIVSSFHFWLQW